MAKAKVLGPDLGEYARLLEETQQGHTTRRLLYEQLEQELGPGKVVVAFFTSFRFPVVIQDDDVDMLEELLQNTDLDGQELVLIVNSPGGEGLAAERTVNVCRCFSGGKFSAIVPKMAKSAATMICLGAHEIMMSKTSELGPIDPQIPIRDDRGRVYNYMAAHEIIESYRSLQRSANRTKGNLEPYLQQLQRFDAREIRHIQSEQDLSLSIAVNCLKTGVLASNSEASIKRRIKPFLDPRQTKVHGRPIYHDVAKACGLNVVLHDVGATLWRAVWKLYVRLNWSVNNSATKIIESRETSFISPVPEFMR